MEKPEKGSGCEKSTTFPGLNLAFADATTSSLGLAGAGRGVAASRDKDPREDDARPGSRLLRKPAGAAGQLSRDVILREWLDSSERQVDPLQCFLIFRHVVEAVGLAHSQGVAVNNIRPSCFTMSTSDRVAFMESASCLSFGSDSYEDDGGRKIGDRKREASCSHSGDVKMGFPLKQIVFVEYNWYTSPEEAAGDPSTFASDIYRLGVLLFELFCKFTSLDDKLRTMTNLRHRVLPPQLLLKWPKVASFCLWLLHPQPNSRPKMSEICQSEFLNETTDSLEERGAAIRLREEIEDQELLLEFLLQLQQRKQEAANKLHDTVCFLSADIDEVVNQQLFLKKEGNSYVELKEDKLLGAGTVDEPLLYLDVDEDLSCVGLRKRHRPVSLNDHEVHLNENLAESLTSDSHPEAEESLLSKSSRLMNNFNKLEAAYFATRCRSMKPVGKSLNRKLSVTSGGRGSTVRTEGSSVEDLDCTKGKSAGKSEWINPFLEGLCKYLSFSQLNVQADLNQGDLLSSSNLVCSLAFDRDRELFATAGVNRKIKVFECDSVLDEARDIYYPVVEMTSRSKLSSICWNSYIKNQIVSSDFEGVVQVWDVTRSQAFAEMREHERRIWSIDISLADPTKMASGSDDGAVKLWDINQGGSIATIKTKANVCSVQFPPNSARSIAIGSADHNVYCYDLRNLRMPWCTILGHSKTVSYVKFVDSSTLISASTDNSLKLWDLSMTKSRVLDSPLQTFTGHTNIKNFVGLSIFDGYIATGSETNEVFIYHKAFPMPVLSYKFDSTNPISGREVDDATQFISCVCWRGRNNTLVGANSSGNIKILEMV